MSPAAERDALKSLLDRVDGSASDLFEQLADRPGDGHFFGLVSRAELDDLELAMVLVALAARLAGRVSLSGSDLVARAAPDSTRRLQALASLGSESRLVTGGWLVPEVVGGGGPEAHGTTWRLGDLPFRRACEVFARRPATPGAADDLRAYRTNEEVLMDLRNLSLLYRRRAARLFHMDPWSGTGLEAREGTGDLVMRAREEARRIARRIRLSGGDSPLPLLLRAREEHNLDLDSLVILVTVLFQELVEGVGAVDAVDLVKLVSESETDVIRRRALLRPLVRKKLLHLEGAFAGKDLTADASLPEGVVELLLGDAGAIASDERIDFHAYLERLDSSDAFFDELEGPPGSEPADPA